MPEPKQIEELAGRAIDEGWNLEAVGRRSEQAIDALLAPALQDLVSSLSEVDRERFSGFVPGVERPGESADIALARAKLAHLLDVAMERLRLVRTIALRLEDAPAFVAFPELRAQLDADDLLPAAPFKPLPDAFEYRDHAFPFSPFTPLLLRRKLTSVAAQSGVDLRWRAASSAPVPRSGYHQRLEKAIEYGLSFKDELVLERLRLKHLPTVLRREAPVNDVEAAWDRQNPLDRLEVLRTERRDRVSFLFEELFPLSERHIEVGFVSTRIFHCDSVIGTGTFEHVDASHLIYDVDTYEKRLASEMKDKVKAQAHIKLFWLGSCSIEWWKGLLATTYPSNELVAEYLTGVRSTRPV